MARIFERCPAVFEGIRDTTQQKEHVIDVIRSIIRNDLKMKTTEAKWSEALKILEER